MFHVTAELPSEHCANFIGVSSEASRFAHDQLASIVDSISSVINDVLFAYDQFS